MLPPQAMYYAHMFSALTPSKPNLPSPSKPSPMPPSCMKPCILALGLTYPGTVCRWLTHTTNPCPMVLVSQLWNKKTSLLLGSFVLWISPLFSFLFYLLLCTHLPSTNYILACHPPPLPHYQIILSHRLCRLSHVFRGRERLRHSLVWQTRL